MCILLAKRENLAPPNHDVRREAIKGRSYLRGIRDEYRELQDRSEDARYRLVTFTSTKVVKNGSKLEVTGNFTLHGVTKPVVLDVEGPATPGEGMDHKLHSGFTATTTISRTAFGIGTKFPSTVVSDEVKLTIELEVVKQ